MKRCLLLIVSSIVLGACQKYDGALQRSKRQLSTRTSVNERPSLSVVHSKGTLATNHTNLVLLLSCPHRISDYSCSIFSMNIKIQGSNYTIRSFSNENLLALWGRTSFSGGETKELPIPIPQTYNVSFNIEIHFFSAKKINFAINKIQKIKQKSKLLFINTFSESIVIPFEKIKDYPRENVIFPSTSINIEEKNNYLNFENELKNKLNSEWKTMSLREKNDRMKILKYNMIHKVKRP